MKTQSYYISYEGQKSLMPTEHESRLGWDFSSWLFPYISHTAVLSAEANGFGNIQSLHLPEIIFLLSISNNKSFNRENFPFLIIFFFSSSENALFCLSSSSSLIGSIIPSSHHLPSIALKILTLLSIFCVSIVVLFAMLNSYSNSKGIWHVSSCPRTKNCLCQPPHFDQELTSEPVGFLSPEPYRRRASLHRTRFCRWEVVSCPNHVFPALLTPIICQAASRGARMSAQPLFLEKCFYKTSSFLPHSPELRDKWIQNGIRYVWGTQSPPDRD